MLFASGKFHYKLWSIGEKYHRYDCIWDKYPKVTGGLDSNVKPLNQHEYVMLFTKELHRERLVYNHGVKLTNEKKSLMEDIILQIAIPQQLSIQKKMSPLNTQLQ